ncbi:MAG: hypothetical protein AABY15_02860 [Nanoarchaeota archaeon]
MIFYSSTLTTFTKPSGRNYEIKVTKHPTWLGKKLGLQPKKYKFIGDCTVWHHVDNWGSFSRASTSWEAFLCDVWSRHKHNESNRR